MESSEEERNRVYISSDAESDAEEIFLDLQPQIMQEEHGINAYHMPASIAATRPREEYSIILNFV